MVTFLKFSIILPITLLGASFAVVPTNAADLILPITFDQRSTPMVSLEIEGMPHELRLDTGSEEGLHLRRDQCDVSNKCTSSACRRVPVLLNIRFR